MGMGTLRSPQGASPTHAFPLLRWFALAWMIVWLPAYTRVWGWSNFLHVCDVAVILTCAGLIFDSQLLLSSQAVCFLLGSVSWCADAGSRLVMGRHLFGVTDFNCAGLYPVGVDPLSLVQRAIW